MPDRHSAESLLERFAVGYDFPLDDFQIAGITALIEERSTLVAAPTGAGKTVVGEFAVWHALERGGKCFYTTPIKALSNQKFSDLSARHGAERVGLLTGDNSVNGEAPVVVMTTEVLRNMLYEASPTLRGLHAVVLDEVHYLGDRARGAVWEEVIIQLPPSVQLACLSATVSNAEELGAWLRAVRDSCDVVISEHRPVPLEHDYAINDRIYPVFKLGGGKAGKRTSVSDAAAARQARSGVPNPEIVMLERQSGATRMSRRGRSHAAGPKLRPPRRSNLAEELQRRRWLPAIYFLFSRGGCDAAVEQVLRDGVRLTTREEQVRIRDIVSARLADLPDEDLAVLGYDAWLSALERGVAAHHAGMVPPFKEAVETLFVRGLVKLCFATETLALGINMPARTVVIERLEKWSGQAHELLTPGQFTQLTGRAGRRGLDTVGHAVVCYQRDVDFPTVASLVSRRTEPLMSSFAPSYNMAVNLLRRHPRSEAEALLARSFAQFQADQMVDGDERVIARNREALEGYAANLRSGRGDFAEYWALRRELSRLEGSGARDRRQRQSQAVERMIAELREGDVVTMPGNGARRDLAVIVGRRTSSKGVPLATAVTDDRRLVRLGPREFSTPPVKVGWMALPASGGPRQADYRKVVAAQLRNGKFSGGRPTDGDDDGTPAAAARIAKLREAMRAHPVHADPSLREIEVWAHRHDDLLDATAALERRVRRRTGSLVRQLDRIIGLLTELGYLTGDADSPAPTADGMLLAGLYAETDLVLAEALRTGVLDALAPSELAAAASVFVFETRAKEPPPARFPTAAVREAFEAIDRIWERIAIREEESSLTPTRPPDPGFAEVVWRWAEGAELDEALGTSAMTAGDFVRSAKQVADLLRQLRDAAPPGVADSAHAAARAIIRGVVAYTGI
ncbi:MAG TPA: DEAD/DEAH box helicase [Egibacteraceae bacterium]|nr:DEAD/DEAH box helicase [Egibacteraceae bacterium]